MVSDVPANAENAKEVINMTKTTAVILDIEILWTPIVDFENRGTNKSCGIAIHVERFLFASLTLRVRAKRIDHK
jgi:hypothetical protein